MPTFLEPSYLPTLIPSYLPTFAAPIYLSDEGNFTCNSGASKTLKGILEIFLDAFLGDLKSLTDLAEIGVKLYGEVGSLIMFILLDLKVNRFLCSADVGA